MIFPLWTLWFVNLLYVSRGHIDKDLVDVVPGFEKTKFAVYSGFLDVPGPINGYDALSIHYQFHTSQRDPTKDPLLVWHQGGPGGSSISGLFMEMGYFQVYDHGTFVNPFAWNRISNMLYLETPAGAGWESGYSACFKSNVVVNCSWDDVTQATAYAFTLQAFFKAFPAFANHDMYLIGESYFGTYGPNIAHYILNHRPFNETFRLRGLALGDACWDQNCCGPNYVKYDVDFYFGKGLFSKELYTAIYEACKFPDSSGEECKSLIKSMYDQIGPHDPENVYNNCPNTEQLLEQTSEDMSWLMKRIRTERGRDGGYNWACGGLDTFRKWIVRADVRKALHLNKVEPGRCRFAYNMSGPFALNLYPELMGKLRILVYNGDADPSVPYQGIEDWISNFEKQGILKKSQSWSPWRIDPKVPNSPVAGSITKYAIPDSLTDNEFSFALVRLAGHEVPTYRPEAALTLISSFVGAQPVDKVVFT